MIINSSKFLCIATDVKGVIQLFNTGAELKLGYKSAEVINKLSLIDISDPLVLITRANELSFEFKTPVNQGFDALVFKATQRIEDLFTLTYICKNGSHFQVDVSVTARFDDQDKIVGYFVIGTEYYGTHQEEVLQKELERKFKSYIENAPSPIFIADEKGNYLLVNRVC